MDLLTDLGKKYNTDKSPLAYDGDGHNYTPWYHEEFGDHRDKVKCVFELGINAGASLFMWEEYFPNANIYGADIHKSGLINRGRICSQYVDQHDAQSLMNLRDKMAGIYFDLMIDDGNHCPEDQVLTVNILADRLAPGGRYVIEDIPYGREEWVVDQILWPWKYTIIEFDRVKKSDDCIVVMERV